MPTTKQKQNVCNRRWVANHREAVRAIGNRFQRTPRGRHANLLGRAKARGIPVTITLEDHTAMLYLPCFWCGGALAETGCWLDRLNSSLGYTKSNVVPCCPKCNEAKNDVTTEDFLEWVARVYNHHQLGDRDAR